MVSAIIPNYNHALYLKQRIESVINQTYRDFEVIILDDYSTDDSRNIIESYRDHPKIAAIVYNAVNSGSVFNQWKKGISLAKGEFVWIAESDDWADTYFLEEMVDFIRKDTSVGIAYCDSVLVSRDEERYKLFSEVRNELMKNQKWSNDYISSGIKEVQENLVRYCTINNASSVLFKKAAFQKSNVFDRDFRYIGDWYVYLKISLESKVAYRNKAMNFYRSHAQNASLGMRNWAIYAEEYFKLYDWILKNVKFVDRSIIINAFDSYVSETIFKNWDKEKIKLYIQLFSLNKELFLHMVKQSVVRSFRNRILKVIQFVL